MPIEDANRRAADRRRTKGNTNAGHHRSSPVDWQVKWPVAASQKGERVGVGCTQINYQHYLSTHLRPHQTGRD